MYKSYYKILNQLFLYSILLFSANAFSANEEGTIRFYFFEEGEPTSGIRLYVDKTEYQTDKNGAVTFNLPVGEHIAKIEYKDAKPKSWKFQLKEEESMLVIASFSTDKNEIELNLESSHEKVTEVVVKKKVDQITGPAATISGQVLSLESAIPVPGVKIYISGLSGAVETDAKGFYSVRVPAGTISISFVHANFSAQSFRNVEININDDLTKNVELTPVGVELAEFTIAAPAIEGGFSALVDEQKNTDSVAEVLGSDQISSSGDSDAAGALKRVTGLSVVDGKFIYVRGLGERYSSTTMNNAGLPSPDPTRRVVPLDLIPTGVLESVVIQKTYSPDMPGEFGGGLVQLRTKGLPEEKMRKISISIGGNNNSTFRDGKTYEGGSSDFLGVEDGSREMPSFLYSLTEGGKKLLNRASDEDQEKAAESVPNTWATKNVTMMPDFSIKTSLADRYESYDGDWGWGYQFSFGYSNKWRFRDEEANTYGLDGDGGLVARDSTQKEKTANEINTGGLLNLSYELGNGHMFSSSTLVARSSTDTVVQTAGYQSENDVNFKDTTLEWVERQLITQQFSGRHEFVEFYDLKWDWVAAYSLSSRIEPFTRTYSYQLVETNKYVLKDNNDANNFSYQDLNDNNISIGSDFTLPIYDFFSKQAKLKSGFNFEAKGRDSEIQRFRFITDWSRNSLDRDILDSASPEDVFIPENLGESGYLLTNNTSPTDNYEASQSIFGFYLKGELIYSSALKFMTGLRWENSAQEVSTFKLLSPDEKDTVKLDKSSVLPAFSTTWAFKPDQQLRFAVSQTVNRPDFKELSEAPYIDPESRDLVIGNKNLEIASISHADLRWEWYLTRFETFAVAGFFKSFKNPIERVIRLGGGGVHTFANADSAQLYGVEMQGRAWLSRLFGKKFSRFYVESNLALINSSVELGDAGGRQTTNTRALQGQSPWLINFTLAYENLIKRINASILFNMAGEHITSAGVSGLPDSYQQPVAQVDFVYSQEVYGGSEDSLKFKFKVKNILDPRYEILQGGELQKAYRKGISGVASLEYSWK